jgi:hypothetical protein
VLVIETDGPAHLGDAVNVTLDVREGGERTPTTEVTVLAAAKAVAMTEVATGLYRGVYVVAAADVVSWGVTVTAAVAANRERAETRAVIPVAEETSGGPLRIALDLDEPADWSPAPGAIVEFTAHVEWQGAPVDPDAFPPFRVRFRAEDGETALNATADHRATGVFGGSVALDPAPAGDVAVAIVAEATHRNVTAVAVVRLRLTFAEAWALGLSVASREMAFKVCVADPEGRALPNALVRFTSPGVAVAVTNASGQAALRMTATGSRVPWWLEGDVTVGGRTQRLRALLPQVPLPPATSGWRLDWGGEPSRVAPGDSAVARYRLLNGSTPWATRYVHYYVTWEGFHGHVRALLDSGNATTDAGGNLTLSFDAPPQEGLIRLEALLPVRPDAGTNDGWAYETATAAIPVLHALEPLVSDPAVAVEVGALRPGLPAAVTITATGTLTFSWDLREADALRLTPRRVTHVAGSTGGFTLPACLPAPATYEIEAEARDPETGEVRRTTIAAAVPAPDPGGGGTPVSVGAIALLAVATGVIAYGLRRRSRRPEAPKTPPRRLDRLK